MLFLTYCSPFDHNNGLVGLHKHAIHAALRAWTGLRHSPGYPFGGLPATLLSLIIIINVDRRRSRLARLRLLLRGRALVSGQRLWTGGGCFIKEESVASHGRQAFPPALCS